MDYVVRAIAESPEAMSSERLGARVQELIAAQLLDEWATQAGLQLGVDVASAEPAYVRSAEEYIDTFARSVPHGIGDRGCGGCQWPGAHCGISTVPRHHAGATIARASVGGCTRRTVAFPTGELSPKSPTPGATSIWACLRPHTGNGSESCLPRPGIDSEDSCLNGHDDRFTHSMNCRDPLFRVGAFCKD